MCLLSGLFTRLTLLAMHLEQHWLIYFFRQFLPCEHWHGFGTTANPSGRSRNPLIFAHFVMASQAAGAEFCSLCVSFDKQSKCGFSCSGPLHPRVCAVCSCLEVKSECLEMLCALPWLGFQRLEVKGIFIFVSQQLK